jgi:hypothetical protein
MKHCIPAIFFVVVLCDPLVTADAQPLDSPGTVYIDGVPCNTPCQAYMEWSRRVQEGSRQIPPDAPPSNVAPADARARTTEPHEPSSQRTSSIANGKTTIARQPPPLPVPRGNRQEAVANGQIARTAPAASGGPAQISVPQVPSRRNATDGSPSTAKAAHMTDGSQNAGLKPPLTSSGSTDPNVDVEPNKTDLVNKKETDGLQVNSGALSAPSDTDGGNATHDKELGPVAQATVTSPSHALKDQIQAAVAVAEQLTLAAMENAHASNTSNDATSQDKIPLVALVLVHSDIGSPAALAGKDIAIDGRHLGTNREVRTALVAAGASDIQIRDRGSHIIDHLIERQVPAAILTLVSQDAADAFPNITGFKLFEIPMPSPPVQGEATPRD